MFIPRSKTYLIADDCSPGFKGITRTSHLAIVTQHSQGSQQTSSRSWISWICIDKCSFS